MTESDCPECGSSSYSTHKEEDRVSEGIVTFEFHSECSDCGYTPL